MQDSFILYMPHLQANIIIPSIREIILQFIMNYTMNCYVISYINRIKLENVGVCLVQ